MFPVELKEEVIPVDADPVPMAVTLRLRPPPDPLEPVARIACALLPEASTTLSRSEQSSPCSRPIDGLPVAATRTRSIWPPFVHLTACANVGAVSSIAR